MRKQKVKQHAQKLIQDGTKPSAVLLADQLEYNIADVHRCLNSLEKNGEVETYTKELFGTQHRMVGVKR